MATWRLALLCALCALGCRPTTTITAGVAATDVEIAPLADGVWLHRSTRFVEGFGDVESNGLIVAPSSGGALLIDTAWTPEQTAALLDWTATHVGRVRAVLVTHWHADRTGGLPEVARRGVASWGSTRTVAEAQAHDGPAPSRTFEDRLDLAALGAEGEAFFPGSGHARDNLVVWLPKAGVLFGGCLVKAAAAVDLGNVADGDLDAWPESVRNVQARYPQARAVVPGHGAPAGLELLTHTLELLGVD